MLSYIRNTIFGYESLSTRNTPFYYVKALYSITHFRVRNKRYPNELVPSLITMLQPLNSMFPDTPGLVLSPQPPLLDWPSNTGPSAGTGIVATPRVFPFSSNLSLSIATIS